ncbi:MAG: GAF domain-containing protein, partial [Pseudomonadota bacterium]|nr:GAF domain-containing protein [Pseudomonadota bacterium]
MRTPPTIVNEHERLAALNKLRVLDTPPEERFDRITRLASSIFDCRFASVT